MERRSFSSEPQLPGEAAGKISVVLPRRRNFSPSRCQDPLPLFCGRSGPGWHWVLRAGVPGGRGTRGYWLLVLIYRAPGVDAALCKTKTTQCCRDALLSGRRASCRCVPVTGRAETLDAGREVQSLLTKGAQRDPDRESVTWKWAQPHRWIRYNSSQGQNPRSQKSGTQACKTRKMSLFQIHDNKFASHFIEALVFFAFNYIL